MTGMEMEGYTKIVKKLYNNAFFEFEDERIPNANVRFSTKVEGTTPEYGKPAPTSQTIVTITIPAGEQLRLLYLNFGSKDTENPAQLIITQSGGTAHALPEGQVDALMIPAGGPPIIQRGTLEAPVHILEGTVTFAIQTPIAGAEYLLSLWGDQNAPQIQRR
ncbi:unnamed protein product [marine sediment metagenome]|uniref:Uncharacterized protein n=1 Tax=marine sediment metagenome TaxID=412755 RepID=X1KMX4_9ZZZZ